MSESITCGMFLYEGYRQYREIVAKESTDEIGGAIEQAEFLAFWAKYVSEWTDFWLVDNPHEDRPGVLAYEVWSPLGYWLAEQIDKGGTLVASAFEGYDPYTYEKRQRRPYELLRGELEARLEEFFGEGPEQPKLEALLAEPSPFEEEK